MDHDTKPTHYEPPGFEPTPRKPPSRVPYGTMTMWLFRFRPLPISAEGGSKRDVQLIPTILGVRTPDVRNLRPMHYAAL